MINNQKTWEEISAALIAMQAERDAALAQNKRMKTFIRMTAEKFEGDHHVEPSMLTLMRVAKEVPDDVLAAHDAEVAEKAVESFINDIGYLDGLTPQCIFKQAEQYAAKLRAKAQQ